MTDVWACCLPTVPRIDWQGRVVSDLGEKISPAWVRLEMTRLALALAGGWSPTGSGRAEASLRRDPASAAMVAREGTGLRGLSAGRDQRGLRQPHHA